MTNPADRTVSEVLKHKRSISYGKELERFFMLCDGKTAM